MKTDVEEPYCSGKLRVKWVPKERNREADTLSRKAYEEYCRQDGMPVKYRHHG